MQSFPTTIVLRHKKENLKKCSLRGLESRPDFKFFTYPQSVLPCLNNYIVLSVDAPPLTEEDSDKGLYILDSTWRYAEKMLQFSLKGQPQLIKRSIPPIFRTAYPRRQDDCIDPERGLASIEAIFIAYHLMKRDTTDLLDLYHWKEEFLVLNSLSL